jgi:ubiquinone/menaquinone biosynthesis C-methylase UbiE
MSDSPIGAGKSSFDLIDEGLFLKAVGNFKPGSVLDLGCGAGNYTMALARYLGTGCTVYGVDLWAEGIAQLKERAAQAGLTNLKAMTGDAGKNIPLGDDVLDVVFMGTVFHDLVAVSVDQKALEEIKRILKPGGSLVIVEFLPKESSSPGPPSRVRLSPKQLRDMLAEHGFKEMRHENMGEHTYLSLFD